MDRRYGYFRCSSCRKTWESSHVYCDEGTDTALYEQDCKDCKTPCTPYRVEKIQCSQCGNTECTCTKKELEDKKRHVDPSKPHLAHLCHKCRAGMPCHQSY
ncbi:zygote arrest protein 2.S-like [Littorina saxatilis]|uniref:3CxxC-type domain-containing protein n=1 Tax=Littorina saxatilis TaxID=31220 RepID=A0AAN9GLG7_9CAEN